MLDNSNAAQAGSGKTDTSETPASFSYCCECGTWDAHEATCRCCGFDFRPTAIPELQIPAA